MSIFDSDNDNTKAKIKTWQIVKMEMKLSIIWLEQKEVGMSG